jgi:predicted dithiol-disulfide oxidoreductase (DUF899 family)
VPETAVKQGGLISKVAIFASLDGLQSDTDLSFLGLEMSLAPTVPNQHHRAGDPVDPLWGLLDMTPEGRGDFFPKINYD